MAANLSRKKVQIQQDDEVRYIFTPTKQINNKNLKNILLQTNFGKEERKQANKVGLVGLFEIEWKTLHHNIQVEFYNNQKLDFEHKKIKVMMAKEQKIINRHLLAQF